MQSHVTRLVNVLAYLLTAMFVLRGESTASDMRIFTRKDLLQKLTSSRQRRDTSSEMVRIFCHVCACNFR